MRSRRIGLVGAAALAVVVFAPTLLAATPAPFYNGFESDTSGWFGPTARVSSGTGGIASSEGAWHAEAGQGAFTNWGGYTDEFPTYGYSTAIDVYFDMDNCPANDSRADWSSAINNPANTHRRDFVFNFGCFTDDGNYFVLSASHDGAGWPKNPARDPFRVDAEGWYTLKHTFYNDGTGVLAVDLSILDSAGVTLHSWTLSDPSDVIGTTVGGNRYGWLVRSQIGVLAIDESRLDLGAPPQPDTKDDCKNGGWMSLGDDQGNSFANQGDCVSFVASKGKNKGKG